MVADRRPIGGLSALRGQGERDHGVVDGADVAQRLVLRRAPDIGVGALPEAGRWVVWVVGGGRADHPGEDVGAEAPDEGGALVGIAEDEAVEQSQRSRLSDAERGAGAEGEDDQRVGPVGGGLLQFIGAGFGVDRERGHAQVAAPGVAEAVQQSSSPGVVAVDQPQVVVTAFARELRQHRPERAVRGHGAEEEVAVVGVGQRGRGGGRTDRGNAEWLDHSLDHRQRGGTGVGADEGVHALLLDQATCDGDREVGIEVEVGDHANHGLAEDAARLVDLPDGELEGVAALLIGASDSLDEGDLERFDLRFDLRIGLWAGWAQRNGRADQPAAGFGVGGHEPRLGRDAFAPAVDGVFLDRDFGATVGQRSDGDADFGAIAAAAGFAETPCADSDGDEQEQGKRESVEGNGEGHGDHLRACVLGNPHPNPLPVGEGTGRGGDGKRGASRRSGPPQPLRSKRRR